MVLIQELNATYGEGVVQLDAGHVKVASELAPQAQA